MSNLAIAEDRLATHIQKRDAEGPELRRLRYAAAREFARHGLPTTRLESWRYTSLKPLEQLTLVPAVPQESQIIDLHMIDRLAPAESRLVFVDGQWVPALSAVPAGVTVEKLERATPKEAAGFETRWNVDESLIALNAAAFVGGVSLRIDAGVELATPIHFVYIGVGGSVAAATHPRAHIHAGAGCRATLVETFAVSDTGLVNAVARLGLGAGARVEHIKLQHSDEKTRVIACTHISLAADATYRLHAMSLGGRISRNEAHVLLDGPGAACEIAGLTLARGEQHTDNRIVVDHAREHTTSRQSFRNVLDDAASTVFDGKVIVRPHAQKTHAEQDNKNLLLSRRAVANTRPQLEIYTDDVRCSHGATVGQLDEDALFYLRARGIDLAQARQILTRGFIDGWSALRDASMRDKIQGLIHDWLRRRA
jgi:Fe-S cluster assembly protein SufD